MSRVSSTSVPRMKTMVSLHVATLTELPKKQNATPFFSKSRIITYCVRYLRFRISQPPPSKCNGVAREDGTGIIV